MATGQEVTKVRGQFKEQQERLEAARSKLPRITQALLRQKNALQGRLQRRGIRKKKGEFASAIIKTQEQKKAWEMQLARVQPSLALPKYKALALQEAIRRLQEKIENTKRLRDKSKGEKRTRFATEVRILEATLKQPDNELIKIVHSGGLSKSSSLAKMFIHGSKRTKVSPTLRGQGFSSAFPEFARGEQVSALEVGRIQSLDTSDISKIRIDGIADRKRTPIQETIPSRLDIDKIILPSGEQVRQSFSEVRVAPIEKPVIGGIDLKPLLKGQAPKVDINLESLQRKISRKAQQVERLDNRGNVLATTAGLGLGLAGSAVSTTRFAQELITRPVSTIERTIEAIPRIPEAIASGVAIARVQPAFATGFVVGEVLTAKGIGKGITKVKEPTRARFVGIADEAGLTRGVVEVKPRVGQPKLFETAGKELKKIDKVSVTGQLTRTAEDLKPTGAGVGISGVTQKVSIGKDIFRTTVSATETVTPTGLIRGLGRAGELTRGKLTAILGEEFVEVGRKARRVPFSGFVARETAKDITRISRGGLKTTAKTQQATEQIGKAIQKTQSVAKESAKIAKVPSPKIIQDLKAGDIKTSIEEVKESQEILSTKLKTDTSQLNILADSISKEKTKTKTLTKLKQKTESKTRQSLIEAQIRASKQQLKSLTGTMSKQKTKLRQLSKLKVSQKALLTTLKTIPKTTKPIKTPKGELLKELKLKQGQTRGYVAEVKREGKFKRVTPKPVSRAKAIKRGANITKQTIAAQFRVRPTNQAVKGKTNGARPNPQIFRNYRLVKGKRVQMQDQWIERRGKRLTTRGEVREIRSFIR